MFDIRKTFFFVLPRGRSDSLHSGVLVTCGGYSSVDWLVYTQTEFSPYRECR